MEVRLPYFTGSAKTLIALIKLNMQLSYYPAIASLGIYPKEVYVHTKPVHECS